MKLVGEIVDMDALQKIRSIADYQFGRDAGKKLFPDEVRIVYSKNTGKIRHIHLKEELLATLRPTTGLFILTQYRRGFTSRVIRLAPASVKTKSPVVGRRVANSSSFKCM